MKVKKDYGIVGKGIYNMISNENKVFIACRDGNLCVFDFKKEKISYYKLSTARLWSLTFFDKSLVIGDFKGNLFINKKKIKLTNVAIWGLCKYKNKLVVGTADMRILFLNKQFKIEKELKLNEPITHLFSINSKLPIAGYFGGLYILNDNIRIKKIIHLDKVTMNNPIWSISQIKNRIGVAWANGTLALFWKEDLN